jgi:hypothetical protein
MSDEILKGVTWKWKEIVEKFMPFFHKEYSTSLERNRGEKRAKLMIKNFMTMLNV